MTSASANSLSIVQFMYLYRTTSVMSWIPFKTYFQLNVEVLQGNTPVISIFHSLKGLTVSGRNFHTTAQQLC